MDPAVHSPSILVTPLSSLIVSHMYELQGLPLTHTDCGEFFTAMRDLVFENQRSARCALSALDADALAPAGTLDAKALLGNAELNVACLVFDSCLDWLLAFHKGLAFGLHTVL